MNIFFRLISVLLLFVAMTSHANANRVSFCTPLAVVFEMPDVGNTAGEHRIALELNAEIDCKKSTASPSSPKINSIEYTFNSDKIVFPSDCIPDTEVDLNSINIEDVEPISFRIRSSKQDFEFAFYLIEGEFYCSSVEIN